MKKILTAAALAALAATSLSAQATSSPFGGLFDALGLSIKKPTENIDLTDGQQGTPRPDASINVRNNLPNGQPSPPSLTPPSPPPTPALSVRGGTLGGGLTTGGIAAGVVAAAVVIGVVTNDDNETGTTTTTTTTGN